MIGATVRSSALALNTKVTRNISLGVEYNYIDLGSENLAGTTATALPVAIRDHDVMA